MIALVKSAPLRKRLRASATAAYEQLELAAPKAHANAKPRKSGRPRTRTTARCDTTAWTIAESRNPSASGHRISQNMKKENSRADRTALTTTTSKR